MSEFPCIYGRNRHFLAAMLRTVVIVLGCSGLLTAGEAGHLQLHACLSVLLVYVLLTETSILPATNTEAVLQRAITAGWSAADAHIRQKP